MAFPPKMKNEIKKKVKTKKEIEGQPNNYCAHLYYMMMVLYFDTSLEY